MKNDFYVLGIGTSSGALQSLSEFFNELDENVPFAIVLVTHLQEDYRDKLDEILHDKTKMHIEKLTTDMPLKKGTLYVLPENRYVKVENGILRVTPAIPGNDAQAIDIFLKSLASDFKERAIGMILSGTGKDGVQGIREINEKGGEVLVQEPYSALYQSLPRLAIKVDHPDKILPSVRLAGWLNKKYSGATPRGKAV